MKYKFLIIPFLALFVLHCSKSDKNDKGEYNRGEANAPGAKTMQTLQEWQKDSLGCTGKREELLSHGFFRELGVMGASHEQVLEWLGKPSHVRDAEGFIQDSTYVQEETVILTYDTSCICTITDGKQVHEPVSWIDITISRKSNKVVRVLGGVT